MLFEPYSHPRLQPTAALAACVRRAGPRAALGLTWEGVPSIRVLLAEDSAAAGGAIGSGDAGGADHGTVGEASPRTATLLKHPAQARNDKAWQPNL